MSVEEMRDQVIKEMQSGEIPIKDGTVWVCVPSGSVFSSKQLQFFKKASPMQLLAMLAKISKEHSDIVLAKLQKERDESGEEQVSWDTITEVIRSVDGVGEVIGGRIDKEVRSRFE